MEAARQELELLRSQLADLEEFRGSSGWAEMKRMLRVSLVNYENQDRAADALTEDGRATLVRGRGIISGLSMAMNLPDALIEDLQADIRWLKEEVAQEDSPFGAAPGAP